MRNRAVLLFKKMENVLKNVLYVNHKDLFLKNLQNTGNFVAKSSLASVRQSVFL